MNEKIKLLLLDLDETLISKENRPMEDTVKLFEFLSQEGIRFSFATGRAMYFIRDLLKDKPALLDAYFIAYDGALIFNPLGEKVLHSSVIDPDTLGVFLEKKYAAKVFFNQLDAVRSIENNLEDDSSLRPFWKKYEPDSQTYQIYGRKMSQAELQDFTEICEHHALLAYSFPYRKNPSYFSVLAARKSNSKGNAIRMLAKYLALPLREIMIVGDGINDVSSFELDAMTVGTSQAIPEIKKLAKFVLRENQSIHSFIREYLAS